MVEMLRRQLEALQQRAVESTRRLTERQTEKETYTATIQRASQIEAAYHAWQAKKSELEQVEKTAAKFRETEKRREAPRLEIQAAKARLEQELLGLAAEQAQVEAGVLETLRLQAEIGAAQQELAQTNATPELDIAFRPLASGRRCRAEPRLAEMRELKRISQLCATER
jgi:hypothetical protein